MAQNEPITDHTAAGALTSMLRVRLAAETGAAPKPRATAQSAAERTNAVILRAVIQFFMGYSFHLESGRRAIPAMAGRMPARGNTCPAGELLLAIPVEYRSRPSAASSGNEPGQIQNLN
jgi:hypothetical protein